MLPAFLYVGLDATTAKMAPVHGLKAPVFLTDVYAGHFGYYSLTKNDPIGVLQVDTNILVENCFGPYPLDTKRKRWHNTLSNCGVCTYSANIPRHAITRVAIYNPFGPGSNAFINSVITECDPNIITAPTHKSNYAKNLVITRWLACEEIRDEHWPKYESPRKLITFTDNCFNRNELELFYLRPEREKAWWRA